ncbi:MAG TPA: 3-deoxy-7-phosphoheptulonate synthase [Clostridia bacterium]|nr:3-deoxy-7-phosphoheptulonate synthase [Clostridia bacterium]
MIIVVKPDAREKDINEIIALLETNGLKVHISQGTQRTIIGVIGDKSRLAETPIELMTGVEKIVHIMEPYKLVGRAFRPEGSVIDIKGRQIGGHELCMIAGPCAVESREQIMKAAQDVKAGGAKFLRGGAYKPRTSPYAFQGLELEGLKLLREAADSVGLLAVSEIMSEYDLDNAAKYIDVIQIGARNAQNFRLLKEVGKTGLPVLLKRGIAETIDEWLGAAEYIMSEGNYRVILCERGIRTFESSTRNTLDVSAIPVIKSKSHLPIIVDPSHASGKSSFVKPLAMAGIAAGADGLIVEVHPDPKAALSDAIQQLNAAEYYELCDCIKQLAQIMKRGYGDE